MSRTLGPTLVAALLTVVFLAAPASAHGAPAAREYEKRVLADWTGFSGTEYEPMGDGHDLLAIDFREAYLADGQPALLFRLLMQGGDTGHGALRDELKFKVDGKDHKFFVETVDGKVYTHDFDALVGPIPVGDGHPFALDGTLLYSRIGAQIGSKITNIVLQGYSGGYKADVAPGGFHVHSHTPADDVALGPTGPADTSVKSDITLAGPPALLEITAAAIEVEAGSTLNAQVTVKNKLAKTAQLVEALVSAGPEGAAVSLSETGFELAAGASKVLNLTVVGVTAQESAAGLLFRTDLGSRVAASVPIVVVAPPEPEPEVEPEPIHDASEAEHGAAEETDHVTIEGGHGVDADSHGEANDHEAHMVTQGPEGVAPGAGTVLVAAGLLAGALVLRRRA